MEIHSSAKLIEKMLRPQPEYYNHSSCFENLKKSMSEDKSNKKASNSYLEFRVFTEENLNDDKWKSQAEIHHRFIIVYETYRKCIENL